MKLFENRKVMIVLCAGIVGVILMLVGGEKEKTTEYSEEAYARYIESELLELCSSVSGVSDCRLLSVRWIHSELSAQQVNYVGLGPVVTITNREERMYSKVLVWYKRYVPEEGYYLGGSAYSACLLHLQPGEQRILKPQMYDSSCARVVRIEVNE